MKKMMLLLILLGSLNNFGQNGAPRFDSKGNIIKGRGVDFWDKYKANFHINSKKTLEQKTFKTNSISQRDSSYFWLWDTITANWSVEPFSKMINTVDSSIFKNWNGNSWIVKQCFFGTLDAFNNDISEVFIYWTGNSWVNDYRNLYTYDANNNQTSYLYQTGNGSNWVNSDQEFYTYDANNNQTNFLSQTWNGSSWDNVNKHIMVYDVNNNQTSYLSQTWNGSSWDDVFKTTNIYDLNNNQTSSLTENWNGTSWENSVFYTYTYDINNNWIGFVSQLWNGTSWNNWQKCTKNYDVNNRIIYELYEQWNGGVWENNHQNFYTHGTNATIVTNVLYQNWNGSVWVNSSKSDDTYDINGSLLSEAHKNWNNSGTHVVIGDSAYHYYHVVTGLEDLKTSIHLSIYPNPTNSIISIASNVEYSSVKIVNSIGQTVVVSGNKPELVSVSDLSNGIYFIQILDKNDRILKTEKFIKN